MRAGPDTALMSKRPDLNQLSAQQLRALVTGLFDRAEKNDRALVGAP